MTVLGIIFPAYNGFARRFISDWSSFEATPNLQGYWIRVPPGTTAQEVPEPQREPDGSLVLLESHAQLLIGQTWTEMEAGYVDLDSEYRRSDSSMIVTDDAPDPELIWTYQRESLSETPSQASRGTVRLRYLDRDGPDRLVGCYYTDGTGTREKLEFVRRTNPVIPLLVNEVDEPEI
jgi:hypothetical protein